MRRTMLAALLAAALIAGCGDDGSGGGGASAGSTAGGAAAPAQATDTIRISDFKYQPAKATVKAGQKITVINEDSAPHTITEKNADPSFDSGDVKGGQTGSVTFDKPGTYSYVCEFHAFMNGEVTVTK